MLFNCRCTPFLGQRYQVIHNIVFPKRKSKRLFVILSIKRQFLPTNKSCEQNYFECNNMSQEKLAGIEYLHSNNYSSFI